MSHRVVSGNCRCLGCVQETGFRPPRAYDDDARMSGGLRGSRRVCVENSEGLRGWSHGL
jgi:hypothetical protein